MKQYAKNACGSVAIYHSVLNSMELNLLQKDGIMHKFFEQTKALTKEERGLLFKNDKALLNTHKNAVQNQMCASEITEEVDNHFVAFIQKGVLLTQTRRYTSWTASRSRHCRTGRLRTSLS